MKQVHFSLLSALTLSLTLVGCGSNVKLNEVAVEDRSGAATAASPTLAPAAAPVAAAPVPAARAVAPVEIRSADSAGAGPAGVARVIYFDYDSFTVRSEFQSAVDAHSRFLTSNKAGKIAI